MKFILRLSAFLIAGSLIILAPAAVQAQNVPFTCEDQFYLTLGTVPPTLNEVVIDPQTSNVVFQNISPNIGVQVNAIGYRSVDNFIYGIDPSTLRLFRFDATGFPTFLATLPLNPLLAYFAGDISPDGRYLVLIGTVTYSNGIEATAQIARVDLETPGYPVTVVNTNVIGQIYDIAFHPFTDELYGYDSYQQRLALINPETGVISFPFPSSGTPVITGSLFFDALGNLFAYGSQNLFDEQNTLYQIDPLTGVSRLLLTGAPASSSDGCSCPYTIRLFKTVNNKRAYPCDEVEYTFEIINSSRRDQLNLRLEDHLPPGFTFVSVVNNTVGGTVTSVAGDTVFKVENITLPTGKTEITIKVQTGAIPGGIYRNQAVLYGIPQSLGGKRVSDNPETLVEDDSTSVLIEGFAFDSVYLDLVLCAGSPPLVLNPVADNNVSVTPDFIEWNDGRTSPTITVDEPGQYTAVLSRGCDTAWVFYTVVSSSILVDVENDQFLISLGDSITLQAGASNSGAFTTYQWLDPQPGSIRCPDCAETVARPFNDIRYTIVATNELGCTDSAFVFVKVDKNRNIYFPNVFMPAAVQFENQYFFPSGDNFTQIKSLSVFSRWGEQVFESRNVAMNEPRVGWDGNFRNQEMQPGVYVWVAQVVFLDGLETTLEGEVTLIR